MSSNQQKPFVSVIVPVYNGVLTIEKNIKALLEQEYPKDRYEIIYVDNNSTDATAQVIQKYPVNYIKESSQQNSYTARNAGVRHAKGIIFAFTDTDCIPTSHWISEIVACIEQGDDVVAGNISFTFSSHPTAAELTDSVINLDNKSGIMKGLGKTANLSMTKQCFDEIGSFSEERTSGGDGQWTSRAFRAGKRMAYAERATVFHTARNFRDLIKKHMRVGQGSIGVWQGQGRSFFWMMARFFTLFLPILSLQIPGLVHKRKVPGIYYPILRMMVIAYVCKLATGYGIIKSLFISKSRVPERQGKVFLAGGSITCGPDDSWKDFFAFLMILIREKRWTFVRYIIRAQFLNFKRSYFLILKQGTKVIGGSVVSDFPLIPGYFDQESLAVMRKLSQSGYAYAASFFIADAFRNQGIATELMNKRLVSSKMNYYFVASSKTYELYTRLGVKKIHNGQHTIFFIEKKNLETKQIPLVSVIVPIYNRPNHIAPIIETVKKQTWNNWELIFVDDASTDTTWQELEKIAKTNSSIRIIRRKKNGGVAAARNTGIRESKGEYIALLDSDDRWLPKKLEKQVAMFEQNQKIGMVYTGVTIVGNYGLRRNKRAVLQGNLATIARTTNIAGSPSRVMIRKSVLDDVGLFDEELPSLEDRDMWLRIAQKYPIGVVPDPMVEYHETIDSISIRTDKKVGSYEAFWKKHGIEKPAEKSLDAERARVGHKLCYYGAMQDGRTAMMKSLKKNFWQPKYWFLVALSFFGHRVYYSTTFFLLNYVS